MAQPPYSAAAIANWFLQRAWDEQREVTHLKLQKLVYIAHGWHLVVQDAPLISEAPEAWKYGPVIRSLYREFRQSGSDPITRPAFEYETSSPTEAERYAPIVPRADIGTWRLLQGIWETYRDLSAQDLSDLTHRGDTPWRTVWMEMQREGVQNRAIPNRLIKDHFATLLDEEAP